MWIVKRNVREGSWMIGLAIQVLNDLRIADCLVQPCFTWLIGDCSGFEWLLGFALIVEPGFDPGGGEINRGGAEGQPVGGGGKDSRRHRLRSQGPSGRHLGSDEGIIYLVYARCHRCRLPFRNVDPMTVYSPPFSLVSSLRFTKVLVHLVKDLKSSLDHERKARKRMEMTIRKTLMKSGGHDLSSSSTSVSLSSAAQPPALPPPLPPPLPSQPPPLAPPPSISITNEAIDSNVFVWMVTFSLKKRLRYYNLMFR